MTTPSSINQEISEFKLIVKGIVLMGIILFVCAGTMNGQTFQDSQVQVVLKSSLDKTQ